ncbi:DUF2934 domain-containing protein [Paraburkholderia fynbosensis]|uniref:DUF2934 domain-containing protein n=1 Tax=Paraburkholderia fynbosensis TaxID=1200993 RepID=A0A6J5GP74_9BURK|nr:DUF2934 domain-containing protein [Paraburkholderia fynbosensis]CAB3803085.1 hypothetical protein LMG27177_05385 [Paraburkholderia fynbosensis]
METETIEQRIRAKAYALWQEDGSMEGCADEYWKKARALVEAEVAEERRREAADGPASNEERRPATDDPAT